MPAKVKAVFLTLIISTSLTLLGIYGMGEYGYSLFIITPLLLGFLPVIIYSRYNHVTITESIKLGLLTYLIANGILFIFAFEGIVCIFMALPISMPCAIVGSIIAYYLVNAKKDRYTISAWLLIITVPVTSFVEHQSPVDDLMIVTTEIEINANINTVWENVIEFPELDVPEEFLFNYGISYPISARIEGKGVGAMRYCNFSTGSFKEPITTWNAPTLLQFDVDESPAPMKELSIWEVDAPHLHNYFTSKKGEFRLLKISDNKTLLIGTTWYVNNIRPVFYWKIWSDYIIHKIHLRVLNHIKINSEK